MQYKKSIDTVDKPAINSRSPTSSNCLFYSEAKVNTVIRVSPELIRDILLRACERVLVLRYSLANKYLTIILL